MISLDDLLLAEIPRQEISFWFSRDPAYHNLRGVSPPLSHTFTLSFCEPQDFFDLDPVISSFHLSPAKNILLIK